jgi:hypothetical protein
MAQTHVECALKTKQDEIRKQIAALRKQLRMLQGDLDTISKTLLMFGQVQRKQGKRLFSRGELPNLIFEALREAPDGLEIEELAAVVLEADGFDRHDKKLSLRETRNGR